MIGNPCYSNKEKGDESQRDLHSVEDRIEAAPEQFRDLSERDELQAGRRLAGKTHRKAGDGTGSLERVAQFDGRGVAHEQRSENTGLE